MAKKCLINVEGGLGKNVMLTALMPIISRKYEEIYVISPYVDVFKVCSYVTDAFEPGPQCASIYQELVLEDDCDILWKEPYSNSKFIKKRCHLFDAWLEEFGIQADVGDRAPIMDTISTTYPDDLKQLEELLGSSDRPIILVQFCGGQSPLDAGESYNPQNEFIKRNYPHGQELVHALQAEYPDARIIHYALPNEPSYDGAEKFNMPYTAYRLLAEKAFKVVCTDSSLQHIATGACNDVTVIWGETRPEHFGYVRNKNIVAKDVHNLQPYFKPMGISPSIVRMPPVEEVMEVVRREV